MTDFIPVNEPLLDGNEKIYINECLDTGWISSEGPFVARFEEQFAKRVDRRYGITVANGTAALETAVAALGIGPGDEVILPSFTIISCASAIVRAGATPVVVDCDTRTWNMDVSQVEDKISSATKAIMVVHIYGLPVDLDPILNIASRYRLHIIEDSAEAIGQTYNGRPCGGFGDISTFSFYPNKHITTGEGGMIVTDDKHLAERCRLLRNLCFKKNKRFVHDELGWNYRMSNLQAALGLAQLENLDAHLNKKRRIGLRYTELLGDIPGLQLPLTRTDYAENLFWVYGLVLKDSFTMNADDAMSKLASKNIGTRPFFWPIHQQPVLQKMGFFHKIACPISERLARNGFYIPCGLTLTEEQQLRVANAVCDLAI